MTAALQSFTLEEAAQEWGRMMLNPTLDDRHLRSPLGPHIADYLRWKEGEDGAAARTIDSYERDLAHLALACGAALDGLTIDHLRGARDLKPLASRHRVTAVYRDFCEWLYQEGRTPENIAGRLRYPRRIATPLTELFNDEEKAAIVSAQTSIRDRVGVLLLLRAGIRKGELRQLRVRDLDLRERVILVRRGKGGNHRRVPVRGSLVQALDEYLLTEIPDLGRLPEPGDYVLYPLSARRPHHPNPSRPMADSTAHVWWYQCLARAEVVEPDASSGRKMHTTRHTYATDLGRATGWNFLAVQKNLGHAKFATTVDTYTQFSFEDQEAAVDMLPEIETL